MPELKKTDDAEELLKMKMKPGYPTEAFAFHQLANFTIFVTDLPLGILMLWLYLRIKRERDDAARGYR